MPGAPPDYNNPYAGYAPAPVMRGPPLQPPSHRFQPYALQRPLLMPGVVQQRPMVGAAVLFGGQPLLPGIPAAVASWQPRPYVVNTPHAGMRDNQRVCVGENRPDDFQRYDCFEDFDRTGTVKLFVTTSSLECEVRWSVTINFGEQLENQLESIFDV